jgi:hypothetical protein
MWEYNTIVAKIEDGALKVRGVSYAKAMNTLGQDGWELVSVTTNRTEGTAAFGVATSFTLWFKRKLDSQPPGEQA